MTSTSRWSSGASTRPRAACRSWPGAGSNSTVEASISQARREGRRRRRAGGHALLQQADAGGLYQHFKAINDAIGIPIIIYNIPPRSVIDMSVDTMKRLYELKNIAGVKDATANMTRVSQQRAACGEDFNQLSGEDITALGFNAHGGHGCISVTSNVAPRLCSEFQAACRAATTRRAEAAGQARAAAHQPVRRDEPGAGQIRDVADRQVRRHGAPADGSGIRKARVQGARGDGPCGPDQLRRFRPRCPPRSAASEPSCRFGRRH
jgi:hypothetical protein